MENVQKKLDASLREQRKEIVEQVCGDIKKSTEAVVAKYVADMENARDKMISQTGEFNRYLDDVNKKNKQLVFRCWLAVSVSLLLLLAGGIWISTHYAKVIQQNKINAELMKSINEADWIKCGDDICARLGKGKVGEYRVIRKR
ncbi:hypothetical protein [Neisseria dentiae]|uniref:hypothetical protein n=1 Tax=Neisseria dentiae TaxID=194197 RepID=UPI000A193AEF|nr:hypothetical protein [Neisseria dentiae]QMT44983.1 lytic enzyme [Neisseria dentiae]STZ50728.1 Uncharacterised protein [Neisseria dentiae]